MNRIALSLTLAALTACMTPQTAPATLTPEQVFDRMAAKLTLAQSLEIRYTGSGIDQLKGFGSYSGSITSILGNCNDWKNSFPAVGSDDLQISDGLRFTANFMTEPLMWGRPSTPPTEDQKRALISNFIRGGTLVALTIYGSERILQPTSSTAAAQVRDFRDGGITRIGDRDVYTVHCTLICSGTFEKVEGKFKIGPGAIKSGPLAQTVWIDAQSFAPIKRELSIPETNILICREVYSDLKISGGSY